MANQGTGLTLVKRFSYRGNPEEEWSNTYWFFQAAPNDATEWAALYNELWGIEKQVIPSNSALVQVYGYNDRTYKSHAVFDDTLPTPSPGSFPPPADGIDFAGDQAAMVGWKTDHKNSRGKWVYLRKYLHDGFVRASSPDFLSPEYVTALEAYADAIRVFHGGLVPGPSKDDPTPGVYTITANVVHDYVTTRTLKRRGKRPKQSP